MSTPVNKAELIDAVAVEAGISKAEAMRAVNAVTDILTKVMASGSSLSLAGFGTFYAKARAERTGRNPQTGASMIIPAANIPAFKASKTLKDVVNSSFVAESKDAVSENA